MKTSITKYIIGGVIVAVIAAYAIWSGNNNSGSAGGGIPPLATNTTNTTSTAPAAGSGASGGGGSAATSGSSGQYKDGTYTGTVADAFYGQLQVTATVSGGKLTDMSFPQYPNNPGHTIVESQMALPVLREEAIAAQSADVQIVSGATQTSQAFQQSLGAALAQAH